MSAGDGTGRGRAEVLVSGYASIDEAYVASRLAGPSQTAILRGAVRPAPRPGGCGPNTARMLAGLGVRSRLVTWVGDDPQGRAFVAGLEQAGVDVSGIEIGSGPSPRSLLIYDDNGDAACYFHPSGSAEQRFTAALRDQLPQVAWLAITVGPASLTEQLLDARAEAPDAALHVAWNVKGDLDAFPPSLCRRLVEADFVCLNSGELAFVAAALELPDDATPAQLVERGAGTVVLTSGSSGYTVTTADGEHHATVEPVEVADPTGAGDAFFAGIIAGLLGGASPIRAAERGAEVARDYLLTRSAATEEASA